MIHEDERRVLESFPEAKIITAKKDTVIGKHYHKIKTEKFLLASGTCEIVRNNATEPMIRGVIYSVKPNTYHEFHIKENSVLIGFNSHPYDPTDDYKD
jgi:quercetin dioxygenase-like cupin family protein